MMDRASATKKKFDVMHSYIGISQMTLPARIRETFFNACSTSMFTITFQLHTSFLKYITSLGTILGY